LFNVSLIPHPSKSRSNHVEVNGPNKAPESHDEVSQDCVPDNLAIPNGQKKKTAEEATTAHCETD